MVKNFFANHSEILTNLLLEQYEITSEVELLNKIPEEFKLKQILRQKVDNKDVDIDVEEDDFKMLVADRMNTSDNDDDDEITKKQRISLKPSEKQLMQNLILKINQSK